MRFPVFTVLVFCAAVGFGHAGVVQGSASNEKEELAASQYTLPSEPDYEEEKLRFQRGSVPYYGLPQYSLKTENSHDESNRARESRTLLKAAGKGNAQAQYRLGVIHVRALGVKQDYAQARKWFLKAAAQNHAAAQVFLGVMSEQGIGTGQDYRQAQQWYEKAAARRSPDAQFMLGLTYYQGKGVPQDYAQARYWFQKAAERNYAAAQYNLGVMALGQGMKRDAVEAYQWFRLVKLAFYPGGTYNLEKVTAELTPEQTRQADAWIQQWLATHQIR